MCNLINTHTHAFQRSLLEWKQNNLRFRIIVESHTVYDVACATCGICMLFWTRACLALSSTLQWSLLEISCVQLALCSWTLLIGDKRHRYTFGSPDKLGTNPMVVAIRKEERDRLGSKHLVKNGCGE